MIGWIWVVGSFTLAGTLCFFKHKKMFHKDKIHPSSYVKYVLAFVLFLCLGGLIPDGIVKEPADVETLLYTDSTTICRYNNVDFEVYSIVQDSEQFEYYNITNLYHQTIAEGLIISTNCKIKIQKHGPSR